MSEEAIISSNLYLKIIFDNISDAVLLIDTEGIIKSFNNKAKGTIVLNIGKDLRLEESVFDYLDPSRVLHFKNIMNRVVAGETITYRNDYTRETGLTVSLEFNLHPGYVDGKITSICITGRDITSEKEIETKRAFEKRNTEALINNTDDLFWSVSKEFKLITANQPFENSITSKTGLTIQAGDDVLITNTFSAEFIEFWKNAYLKTLSGHIVKEEILVPGLNNANDAWWEIHLNPIYKGESVEAIACFSRDITGRKLSEEKLKLNESRFAVAQMVAKVGSWETDLSDYSVEWSAETYRIFDVDPQRTTFHESFLSFVHPEDRDKVARAFEDSLFKNHICSIEHRILTESGLIKEVEERWSVIRDKNGKPIKAIGTCQDITEKKQSLQKIEESELRYRSIVETAQEGIWLIDENNLTTFVNTKMCQILEYSQEEMIGKDIYYFMDDEGKKMALDLMVQKKHGQSSQRDFKYISKSGREVWTNISANPIFDRDGNYKGSLGMLTDITERKKSEKYLQQTNEELRTLYAYLENVREDERKRIAREIHDELGQLLTAIKMDLSSLKKKLPGIEEPQEKKIKDLFGLIDNAIGTVRRIASELRPGILDDLGLEEAIKWQLNEFKERTGIEVSFSSNVGEEKISPEITIAIFRIFQESLTNIARHARATLVNCELLKTDNQIVLTIRDNGTGFDINKKDKAKHLGLLGIKERTSLLKGTYELSSELTKGTNIKVTIPLS